MTPPYKQKYFKIIDYCKRLYQSLPILFIFSKTLFKLIGRLLIFII